MDENDQWGFSSPRTDFSYAMMASAGIGFYFMENGKMTYALNNEKAITALDRLNKIITTDRIRFPVENNDAQNTAFGNGNTLFYFYKSGNLMSIVREYGDMGILPMPIGPGRSGYVSLGDHNSSVIMIPSTNKDLKATSLLLEALAFANWKLLPEYVENYEALYLDPGDTLSSSVIYNNYAYQTIEPWQFNQTSNYNKTVNAPILAAIATANEDISGVVASIRNAAQSLIDQFFGQ